MRGGRYLGIPCLVVTRLLLFQSLQVQVQVHVASFTTTSRNHWLTVRRQGHSLDTITTTSTIASTSTSSTKMQGTVYIATSLDGYIAAPDGGIEWLNALPPPSEAEGDMGFAAHLASIDVMIMGRKTFEKVLSFGVESWAYGDIQVVVWSRSMTDMDIPENRRNMCSCSSLAPAELFAKLEQEGHARAYIDGGVTIQKFLEAGLIQEICLSTVPILLGSGIKLFAANGPRVELKLKHSKSFTNGIVQSFYQVTSHGK
jgi:dihydrofolate reductase